MKKLWNISSNHLRSRKKLKTEKGEAGSYGNLGTVYQSVGEYKKAMEHLQKSLAIEKEIGDKKWRS